MHLLLLRYQVSNDKGGFHRSLTEEAVAVLCLLFQKWDLFEAGFFLFGPNVTQRR
jgi:hypothetical protein